MQDEQRATGAAMTEINAADARLRARLGDAERGDVMPPSRTWDPRKDDPDTLIGVLVSTATVVTRYGPADVATLRDGEGDSWAVWLSSSTMKSEWERAAPLVGETVAVHYGGTRDTKDGQRTYPLFTVLVDRPDDAGTAPASRFGEAPPW